MAYWTVGNLDLHPGIGDGLKKGGQTLVCQPPTIPGDAATTLVTYFAHMAVFSRTENGITSTMDYCDSRQPGRDSPDTPAE